MKNKNFKKLSQSVKRLVTIFLLKLNSSEDMKVIAANRANSILLYKESIIMSLPSQHKVCILNETDGLQVLTGCVKEGNLDGKASYCGLYQPIGICVELDNVL